jgi:tRNA (guanosine-2'-O-)-methyltransferase
MSAIDIEKSRIEKRRRIRSRADEIKKFRCKNLIAVIEDPMNLVNVETIIRNIEALGVEKTYVVDPRGILPNSWQEMRERRSLKDTSVSAIKWSFVKRFDSTEDCLRHLKLKNFTSVVTSPHTKGRKNVILHEGDYTQKKLAVWFGTESKGISDLAVAESELCINIPMYGFIESLNLGTSTGIVMYEITKQRRDFQNRDRKDKKT